MTSVQTRLHPAFNNTCSADAVTVMSDTLIAIFTYLFTTDDENAANVKTI